MREIPWARKEGGRMCLGYSSRSWFGKAWLSFPNYSESLLKRGTVFNAGSPGMNELLWTWCTRYLPTVLHWLSRVFLPFVSVFSGFSVGRGRTWVSLRRFGLGWWWKASFVNTSSHFQVRPASENNWSSWSFSGLLSFHTWSKFWLMASPESKMSWRWLVFRNFQDWNNERSHWWSSAVTMFFLLRGSARGQWSEICP